MREWRSLPSVSCIYNRQFRRRPDLSPRIDVREKRDPDFLQEAVETPLQNTYLRDDASLTTSWPDYRCVCVCVCWGERGALNSRILCKHGSAAEVGMFYGKWGLESIQHRINPGHLSGGEALNRENERLLSWTGYISPGGRGTPGDSRWGRAARISKS